MDDSRSNVIVNFAIENYKWGQNYWILPKVDEMVPLISEGLRAVQKVEDFVDATIGEDCAFECKGSKVPAPRPGHVPTSNGRSWVLWFFQNKRKQKQCIVSCLDKFQKYNEKYFLLSGCRRASLFADLAFAVPTIHGPENRGKPQIAREIW